MFYSCSQSHRVPWWSKARIPRRRHRLRLARHAYIRTSDTRDFLAEDPREDVGEDVGVGVGVVECGLNLTTLGVRKRKELAYASPIFLRGVLWRQCNFCSIYFSSYYMCADGLENWCNVNKCLSFCYRLFAEYAAKAVALA